MSTKPLHFWSITVAENFLPLHDVELMDKIMTEFFKHWCYQGELGTKLGKRHYQARGILGEPQRKATLISIFECRGFDKRDITFLPESNKSIQQGGLAFYVMDDTKPRFSEMRCDPSYKIPRGPDWIPNQCRCLLDGTRPWAKSLIDIIDGPPSHRSIIWICTLGGFGGVQKSLLVLYLEAINKAIWIGDGTPTQIKEAVISEGEQLAYLVDMPKTFAHDNRMSDYINAIETIKNGFIKTAMNGKRKKLMMNNRPHVIVFANRLPDFSSMTHGRFDCYTIDPQKPETEQTLDRPDLAAQVSPGV